MNNYQFHRFAPALGGAVRPELRDPRLLMDSQGDVAIYYAPFEYLNPKARVALVGITPGPTQMVNANNEAHRAIRSGASVDEVVRAAKDVGAFSGEPLRSNLVRQLNHWGFHRWLGLADSGELFSSRRHLVHSTSLLRYPVFVRGKDYRGAPDMMRHPLLRRYLLENFVEEVRQLENAVFVGLGPQVQQVLDQLVHVGLVPTGRVIGGMLHPSGNCTYRINYLVGDRAGAVPHATNPLPYDLGRKEFGERFLGGR